jgi:hypothetical protein
MKQEREIGYCESCGRMHPWLTIIALRLKCLCGSTKISRGMTGARGRINEVQN